MTPGPVLVTEDLKLCSEKHVLQHIITCDYVLQHLFSHLYITTHLLTYLQMHTHTQYDTSC